MKQENTLGPPVTKGRGPNEKDQPPSIHNQEGNIHILSMTMDLGEFWVSKPW